jgi:hypothetical protein
MRIENFVNVRFRIIIIARSKTHMLECGQVQHSTICTFSDSGRLSDNRLILTYQPRYPKTGLCVLVVQEMAQEVWSISVIAVPTAEDVREVPVRLCENLCRGQACGCRLRVDDIVCEHQAVTCRDWLDFMSHVSVPVQVSTRKGNNMYAQMFHSPSSH